MQLVGLLLVVFGVALIYIGGRSGPIHIEAFDTRTITLPGYLWGNPSRLTHQDWCHDPQWAWTSKA